VHVSFPYAHAKGIQNEHLKNWKADADAEHACKKLIPNGQGVRQFQTRTLSANIIS
jgi:hypothetical protein